MKYAIVVRHGRNQLELSLSYHFNMCEQIVDTYTYIVCFRRWNDSQQRITKRMRIVCSSQSRADEKKKKNK